MLHGIFLSPMYETLCEHLSNLSGLLGLLGLLRAVSLSQ